MASERIPIPSESDYKWGTNTIPPGEAQTDPGASVRLNGWAFEQIPGHDEFNWLQHLWGEMFDWLKVSRVRQWADVFEGLQNTTEIGDLFQVSDKTGPLARGTSIFTAPGTAATGGPCLDLCTDGEQFYYRSGSPNPVSLIAAKPSNGTELWEYVIGTGYASALHADGRYVYYANANVGVPGLQVHDRTTGAFVRTGGAEYAMTQIRANGTQVVGINPNSAANRVVRYSTLGGPLVENTVLTGNTSNAAVAVDADQIYVGGVRGAGNDIYALTTGLVTAWSINLPTVAAPTINAITTDGNVVYVGTDSAAHTGFGVTNLWALERITGQLLWFADVGAGANISHLAVDHHYLYCVTSVSNLYVHWLRHNNPFTANLGLPIYQQLNNAWGSCAADGVSLVASDSAAGGVNLRRSWFRTDDQLFRRANPESAIRYPFHTLAVPAGEGL